MYVRFSVLQVRFRCFSAFSQVFCAVSDTLNKYRRTARGYRKISHGCKEAVLQSELGHSVGAALQAQGHFASKTGEVSRRNKDRPGKFLEAERLSYLASGKRTFAETAVLSIVADAVHVGQEDWLNVFVCDPAQDLAFVLPQQAGKEVWETENFGEISLKSGGKKICK